MTVSVGSHLVRIDWQVAFIQISYFLLSAFEKEVRRMTFSCFMAASAHRKKIPNPGAYGDNTSCCLWPFAPHLFIEQD